MAYWPCTNPSCKSHGKPHPNCKCAPPGGYAHAAGGSVRTYCDTKVAHLPDCEYYMAEGGEVPQDPSDLAAQVAHGESRRQAGIALANHRQQEELSRLDHPSLKSQHHEIGRAHV